MLGKGKSAGAGTETARLIEALLVSRGQRGASEAELGGRSSSGRKGSGSWSSAGFAMV